MNFRTLVGFLLLLSTAALAAPTVAAAPPTGYDCVGGYNPSALSNICYDAGTTTYTPAHTGSVTTDPETVCIIGNLCEEVPMPSYDPNGGTPVTVPWPTAGLYLDVLGEPVPYTGPCGDGTTNLGIKAADQTVCVSPDMSCRWDEGLAGASIADRTLCAGRTDCYHGNSSTWPYEPQSGTSYFLWVSQVGTIVGVCRVPSGCDNNEQYTEVYVNTVGTVYETC